MRSSWASVKRMVTRTLGTSDDFTRALQSRPEKADADGAGRAAGARGPPGDRGHDRPLGLCAGRQGLGRGPRLLHRRGGDRLRRPARHRLRAGVGRRLRRAAPERARAPDHASHEHESRGDARRRSGHLRLGDAHPPARSRTRARQHVRHAGPLHPRAGPHAARLAHHPRAASGRLEPRQRRDPRRRRQDPLMEDILEPDLPICDPHHHLWDHPGRRYLLDELLADTGSGHDVRATVFVECLSMYRAQGPASLRPVGETEFVNGIAAMSASGRYGPTRVAAGIVSFADLTLGEAVGPVLDAHLAASPRFRGIRHAAGWDASKAVRNSHTNPPRGLLADSRFPRGFAELAGATRGWYRHAIDCFGVGRCLFESNFPVDKVSASYRVLWTSFKRLAASFSAGDKSALSHDPAVRVYGLGRGPA